MVKENNITSIRIPNNVKEKLDNIALEKESYHLTIQRLILENMRLKEDKELLTRLLLKDDD